MMPGALGRSGGLNKPNRTRSVVPRGSLPAPPKEPLHRLPIASSDGRRGENLVAGMTVEPAISANRFRTVIRSALVFVTDPFTAQESRPTVTLSTWNTNKRSLTRPW